jgi:diguanylate cyclase (GGDEF)-like protein
MGITLDPETLFIALVASTSAAVLLLLWTFLLNRHERSLLCMAVGFAIGSVGITSIAFRGVMPTQLYLELGSSMIVIGTGIVWCAARVFNGAPMWPWAPFVGAAIWIAACNVPGFVGNFSARMIVSSLIIGTFYGLAAFEFQRVRDGLRTRVVASVVLALQSAIVLVRIPFVILDAASTTMSFADSSWFGLSALQSSIFVQVVSFLMISLTKERVERRLRDAALTDSLTGVGNRRAFFDWTEAALARSTRTHSPVAAILFDLDRFKDVNDRFGHPVGDAVIQAFADAARRRLRAGDFIARLGGEEFAVALPDTTGEQACRIATDINELFTEAVAAMGVSGLVGSASAGVAESRARPELFDLLAAADRALYEAKALGRGLVQLGAPVPPTPLRVHAA